MAVDQSPDRSRRCATLHIAQPRKEGLLDDATQPAQVHWTRSVGLHHRGASHTVCHLGRSSSAAQCCVEFFQPVVIQHNKGPPLGDILKRQYRLAKWFVDGGAMCRSGNVQSPLITCNAGRHLMLWLRVQPPTLFHSRAQWDVCNYGRFTL